VSILFFLKRYFKKGILKIENDEYFEIYHVIFGLAVENLYSRGILPWLSPRYICTLSVNEVVILEYHVIYRQSPYMTW
jgi:hypothetical protein